MSETALIKLSRLVALRRELDTVANNVANASTTGFKAQRAAFKEFLKPIEQADPVAKPERPVSMVHATAGFTDLSRGAVEPTGSELDVAIDGNAFFVIQTAKGERYTRNGSFTLDSSGRLVNQQGQPVLGSSGSIIVPAEDGPATVNADGTVSTRVGIRGKLRLAYFESPQRLVPEGANTLRSDEQPVDRPVGAVRLVPRSLERSNVQPLVEMSRLVEITRAYELVSGMLKQDGDKNELQRLADVL